MREMQQKQVLSKKLSGVARVAATMPRCRPTRERNRLFIRCVSQLFTDRDNVGDSSLAQRKLYIFERDIFHQVNLEVTTASDKLRDESNTHGNEELIEGTIF